MFGILIQESFEMTIVLCRIMYKSVRTLYRSIVPSETIKYKMIELAEYENILQRLDNLEKTATQTDD